MKIYYDFRMNEFTKEIDPILPQECFWTYELGELSDVVIEKYELANGNRLDYSYLLSLRNQMTRRAENALRDCFFEEHLGKGYVQPRLLSIVIPKEAFLSYCEEAGFDDYIEILKGENHFE